MKIRSCELSSRAQIFSSRASFLIVFFLFSLPLSTQPLYAQGGINYTGNGGRHTIQGRIYFPSGRSSDLMGMKIRLESAGTGSGDLVTLADPNGTFAFKNLTAGSYYVAIEASESYEALREAVYIDDPGASSMRGAIQSSSTARIFNVQVYLQPKREVKEAIKPAVLRAELAAAPKQAQEAYERALAASRAGDNKKAVDELKIAIDLYPRFSVAFTEMGMQYTILGQFNQAARAFQSTLAITPDDFTSRLGYGIALQKQREFSESEKQLREATKRNDGSAIAHMYLGITLVGMKKLSQAQKELERAVGLEGGESLAQAHKYLGGIYWGLLNYKRAADELEKYLKLDPKAADAERIRGTVKDLRSKP
jgi:tetratricopeptide (TPR) repeat protein